MKRLHIQRFAMGAVLFLALEVLLVGWVDRPLSDFMRLADISHHDIIDFFRSITDLGKSFWYLWPLGIGVLGCAVTVRRQQFKTETRHRCRIIGRLLAFVFSAVALSGLITDAIKPLLSRARPVEMAREGIYGFHPLSFHAAMNGMPSGHATTAFALAASLGLIWPKGRYLLFSLAVFLASSRVIVNAHYLGDVVAGGMVGWLTAYLLPPPDRFGNNPIMKRLFPIDSKMPIS